ncbi:PRC-barrel domain-containing protein [Mesobacterium pallidum]|uniref:PRC-barrel domain-containing protein n=1 Tax=Mesobacterium pallidum TaxID=2872037 RepID=UPI001EE1E30F|nr:PRC-barrel domain-containing protein [Mesobacterium pallidum]
MSADAEAGAKFSATSEQGAVMASELIGARLYTSETEVDETVFGLNDNWEDVGEIHDIVLGKDGEVDQVIADIGGFLGIGEKSVAVSMSELKFISDGEDSDDWFVVIQAAAGDLENAPAYESAAVMAPETDLSAQASAEMEEMETDAEMAAEATGDELQDAAAATGAALDNAGEEVDQAVDATGEALDNTGEEVAEAADATGEAIENTGEAIVAEADEATDEMAAEMNEPEYAAAEFGDMPRDEIVGTRVYDANGEWIGEVNSLVETDGTISEAVIDVGGFLGIGEKPVAVSIADLLIEREAEGDTFRISINATEDELKAMPEYEAM